MIFLLGSPLVASPKHIHEVLHSCLSFIEKLSMYPHDMYITPFIRVAFKNRKLSKYLYALYHLIRLTARKDVQTEVVVLLGHM